MRYQEFRLVENKLEGDAVFAKLIKQQFPMGAGYELHAGMTHEMWYKELKLANRWLAAVVRAGELQPPVSIGNDFTIRNKGGMDIGIPGQMTANGKPVAGDPNDKAETDRILSKVRGREVVGESIQLKEGARIDHAEDIIFWEGSKGAIRALESLKQMEQGGHTNVTVKWDGSPALVFGRNEAGEFILTDKSGFVKKGGVERATSGDDLANNLLNRSGGANKEDPTRIAFATNMKDIFDEYERATPKDFRGYLMGDLLYYNTPKVIDGKYTFTPNIVTYKVDVDSDLGKRISQSKTGIVVHRLLDEQGNQSPVPQDLQMLGNEVMIFPSVTVSKPAEIDDEDINQLKAVVAQHAQGIDKMLDVNTLTQMQMKDLPQIFYTYLNGKVDSGLANIGADFLQWIKTSKVSAKKQQKIAEYVGQNKQAFDAMWKVVSGIMTIKDKVINQFDSHDADVKSEIGDHGPVSQDAHAAGGEGYVLAHPKGDIKLVPRASFTKANRSIQR
jgi:hypothetical protein